MLATAVSDLPAMRVLVEGGADPILATEEGTTPLMVAAGMGPDHPSRMTREQKSDLLEAVKLAVQLGGSVNAVTLGGRTALHGAALYGLTDVVEYLAEQGVDLNARVPAGVQNDWAILVGENGIAPDAITSPTLIVHDREDPLVPFAHAEWSHTCIPQSHLLEIHAGGHLIWFGNDALHMHNERVAFIKESLAA